METVARLRGIEKRLVARLPRPMLDHPLGLMAMWGWALLGLAMLVFRIYNLNPTDPKPWPDLLWPAEVSGADEVVGMDILAVGMVVSGTLFIVAQLCIHIARWAPLMRWVSMWMAVTVVVYLLVAMLVKEVTNPDEVAPWWPLSAGTWIVTGVLLLLGLRRSRGYGCEVCDAVRSGQ